MFCTSLSSLSRKCSLSFLGRSSQFSCRKSAFVTSGLVSTFLTSMSELVGMSISLEAFYFARFDLNDALSGIDDNFSEKSELFLLCEKLWICETFRIFPNRVQRSVIGRKPVMFRMYDFFGNANNVYIVHFCSLWA